MTNLRHVDLLRQGVKTWNTWRSKHIMMQPDLRDIIFSEATLSKVNLSDANLSGANLRSSVLIKANLARADLRGANLSGANLSGANLSLANLERADLSDAIFSDANLTSVVLYEADLSDADLRRADLSETDLSRATLIGATLIGATLNMARLSRTIFGDVDLRMVKELETVIHDGPSIIGTSTISRSAGDIPEIFLRKAGVTSTFITYARSLAQHPIEYYTCFISYSSKDQEFTERLYADLQQKGVRCWYAPEDMKTGDKIRRRIDESIRLYDKLLLVLSKHSIGSQWVEHEVEMALAKEQKVNRTVLFPIRLDTAILDMEQDGWPSEVGHTRHITDFTHWKQHDDYQKSLTRLLRDLQPETTPKQVQ